MFLLTANCVFILLGSVIFFSPGGKMRPEGYRAVVRHHSEFFAAGTGGRIDRIAGSGEVVKSETFPGENFNCLLSGDRMIIAAGDNGTILMADEEGIFRKVESNTNKNINSLVHFNGKVIAGCDQGEIITGDSAGFTGKMPLALQGNIMSLSAGRNVCYGVTDAGEIIHSADGTSWDILDFNEVYAGYYKPCHFTRVLVTGDRVLAAGIRDDGSAVVLFSSGGKVWTERKLDYPDEQGIQVPMTATPCDIFYDPGEELFFLACSKGMLMRLLPCPHCNNMAVITDRDLTGIAGNENRLIVVGSDFFIEVLNIRE